MTIDRSTVQLFLFILLAIFSACLLRSAIRVEKIREKEKAARKNQVTEIKAEAS
jgi:membrane protein implicated in regulation of membrane protease activity